MKIISSGIVGCKYGRIMVQLLKLQVILREWLAIGTCMAEAGLPDPPTLQVAMLTRITLSPPPRVTFRRHFSHYM